MNTTEHGIRKDSDYYIYTASAQAANLYFYPMVVGNFTYEPGYHISRSSFDSYLLFFVKSGSCTVELLNKTYQVHEGQIVFLNCYQPHGYATTQGYEALWLHFDGPLSAAYYDMIIGENAPVIDLQDSYRFTKYLKKIYMIFHDKSSCKEAVFNNWIVNILTELITARDRVKTDSIASDMIEDVINYINEHLTKELPLEMLAQKASLSQFYFTRLFKKETGFTPHEYVITARINSAKYLLKSTEESIKEICFRTGFQNESTFCTTFKKKVGITPSDYRKDPI